MAPRLVLASASPRRARILADLGIAFRVSVSGADETQLPGEEGAAAVRGAYLKGESYAELAERHGVPLNTMRTWLRRSLMKLKECLER